MSLIALVDYGSGNVRSVRRALEAAAHRHGIGADVRLTDAPELITKADRIVLPGVGHFADCAEGLRQRPGVIESLGEASRKRAVPFLGVCVGMQLLADVGREDVETAGLGWIGGAVERMRPADPALPVPHMGWNTIRPTAAHPVLSGLEEGAEVYFTHSYVFSPQAPRDVAAHFDYGGSLVAAVARDNLFGTQFHPEKSQAAGLMMLANFLRWAP